MKGPRLRNFLLISLFIHIGVLILIAFNMPPSGKGNQKNGVVSVGLINVKSNTGQKSHNKTTEKQQDKLKNVADNTHAKQSYAELNNTEYREKEMTTFHRNEDQSSLQNNVTTEKKSIKRSEGIAEKKEFIRNETDTGQINNELSKNRLNEGPSPSGDGRIESEKVSGTKGQSLARPDYNMNPKPTYPLSARRRGYEGTVKLRVLVLKSGKVGNLEIEQPSGYSILDNAAVEAVEKWIFIPGRKNGTPVSSWVTVPVKFRLTSG